MMSQRKHTLLFLFSFVFLVMAGCSWDIPSSTSSITQTTSSYTMSATWTSYSSSASLTETTAPAVSSARAVSVLSPGTSSIDAELVTTFIEDTTIAEPDMLNLIIGYRSLDGKQQAREGKPWETKGGMLDTDNIPPNRISGMTPVDRITMTSAGLEEFKDNGGYDFDRLRTALNSRLGPDSDAIAFVEPDYARRAFSTRISDEDSYYIPNDTYYSSQWNMQAEENTLSYYMNLPSLRAITQGDESVVVAVIDTGVSQSLSDLADTTFVTGYDFVNNDSDPTDDNGHGSHVTGTIAQSTGNSIGVAGIAPKVSIMPLKVLDANGDGYSSNVVNAVYYAVNNGADIINMSLGGTSMSTAETAAYEYAAAHGVLIVAAAGNDGVSDKSYPAASDISTIISVGAVGYSDPLSRASYSNYGDWVDVMAFGGSYDSDSGIPSITVNDVSTYDAILQQTVSGRASAYAYYVGTSMAAPHVTGLAALIKSLDSSLSAQDIISRITGTTIDGSAITGYEMGYYGLIDALAALQYTTYPALNSVSSTFEAEGTSYWAFSVASGPISVTLSADEDNSGTYTLTLYSAMGDMLASESADSSELSVTYTAGEGEFGTYVVAVSYAP